MDIQTPPDHIPDQYSKSQAFSQLFETPQMESLGNAFTAAEYGQDYLENTNERLIGGTEELPRPWLALLVVREGKSFEESSRCGGTLINHWYVLTASHCICPTTHQERVATGLCRDPNPRFKIDENSARNFEVCLGITTAESCEQDISSGLYYFATEAIVRPERLIENNSKENDIGLLKMDRKVDFKIDISPICLAGMVKLKPYGSEVAYISGFGNTQILGSNRTNAAECSTDFTLPRPFHVCKDECKTGPAPYKTLDNFICNWFIYEYFDKLTKNVGLIRLNIPRFNRTLNCYPNQNKYGWCQVNTKISHQDFDRMPAWGYCDRQCLKGVSRDGTAFSQVTRGTAMWAKQSLLTHKECIPLLKGITDEVWEYNPRTEMCAAGAHRTLVETFTVENLQYEILKNGSLGQVSGNVSLVESSNNLLKPYYGGKDTCQGDSGGPMWRYQKTPEGDIRGVQIGVVSRGHRCASVNRPGIYTKIFSYKDWIIENTKDGECESFE